MSYRRISLNDNWQLGWKRDPDFNRWIVNFSDWEVKDGALLGAPSTYTRGFIYANCKADGDYTSTFRFTLTGEGADARPILHFSNTRLAGYYVVLRPGEKINAYYVYSDLYEKHVLQPTGPELELDRAYTLKAVTTGTTVELFLDGESLGSFNAEEPCGTYTAIAVQGGLTKINDFAIEDAGGNTLFADDFSENSLPAGDDVTVDYREFAAIDNWISAPVPGTVQTALLEAGLIEDPYLPFNGEKMHWTADQRWFYRTRFTVPEEYRGKRLRLLFNGVDYLADFFLNGTRLCRHEGMFGGPELDITDMVDLNGENELAVAILPCPNPPHSNVRPYILHRWHFNMDIITSGLWRGVELIADDKLFLSEPQVMTRRIKPDGTAVVEMAATVSTMVLWPFEVHLKFTLRSPLPGVEPIISEVIPGFCQGSLRVNTTVEVPNAALWWPNGMGEQPLYDVDIDADIYEYQKQPTPTAHDELHVRTGLRTLAFTSVQGLGEESTHIDNPLGFMNWRLSVNGKPFFGKGSNWMPIDNLLRLDRGHYRRLLTRVKDSNMNILRPWGAGLLENDEFYEICDELGILVWQETLFANGIYNHSKIEVWRETMRRNVCRLRNHPSLAVYCGGNEFDPDLPENKDIIDELIAICGELDPMREFRPACPYGGDNHSYLVNWMGGKPYAYFTKDYSPAITEFSLASPPNMDTLKRLIPAEELENFPPDFPEDLNRNHYAEWGRDGVKRRESAYSILDAHLSGICNIMFPPISECGIPHTMDEFVCYLQTAHGLAMQFGIDFWRSRWPQCCLTMSWVFNVIFPDTMSWSFVDYFETPKKSYFYQKRSYEPLHISASFDELFNPAGSVLRCRESVSNETAKAYEDALVSTRLYDIRFNLLAEEKKSINLRADDTRTLGYFNYEIPENAPDAVLFLVVELQSKDGELLSRSVYCPRIGATVDRMPFLEKGPWISDVRETRTALTAKAAFDGEKTVIEITNTGDVPAFEVTLHAPMRDQLLRYSDNCFFLEKGESRRVTVEGFESPSGEYRVSAWNADEISFNTEDEK